jgi:secondary thiamine-phosphate synthase enzyme
LEKKEVGKMQAYELNTQAAEQAVDVTGKVQEALDHSGLANGAVLVYCPHTTAGVTINENADPTVMDDLFFIFEGLVPKQQPRFRHLEGNSHAHAKASLLGANALVPVAGGRLQLGTWQGIYFMEFDGPRKRRLLLQFLAGESYK